MTEFKSRHNRPDGVGRGTGSVLRCRQVCNLTLDAILGESGLVLDLDGNGEDEIQFIRLWEMWVMAPDTNAQSGLLSCVTAAEADPVVGLNHSPTSLPEMSCVCAELEEGTVWTGWGNTEELLSWIEDPQHVFHMEGPFANQANALLGIRFADSSSVHYGWVRLSATMSSNVSTVVIHDFAYNLAHDMPILAGRTYGHPVFTDITPLSNSLSLTVANLSTARTVQIESICSLATTNWTVFSPSVPTQHVQEVTVPGTGACRTVFYRIRMEE